MSRGGKSRSISKTQKHLVLSLNSLSLIFNHKINNMPELRHVQIFKEVRILKMK